MVNQENDSHCSLLGITNIIKSISLSWQFLEGIRQLQYHAITGLAITRKLSDGRVLRRLHKQGQQVHLVGLKFPVTVYWYYLKRDNGKLEKRFVLSTHPIKASTLRWWGKRRWQIEG